MLSYALQALESYMATTNDFSFLNVSLMEKIVTSLTEPTLNVVKHAFAVTNLFTRPDSPSQGATIFMNKKKYVLDWQSLIRTLNENPELEVSTATLRLINNLLRQQTEQEKDEGSFT
jgi:hypothetical protein